MGVIKSIANLLVKDKALVILLILLSSLIAADPFFHRGIFTAHDIEANIARFGAFANSFREGNLLPRWAKDVSSGYGSPILMFSYSLPYYLALPFRFLGFSLIDSIKILNLLTLAGSAVFMYFFLRVYFQTFPSFLGSLLYVFAPYRISNIYARGSVSENTAFVFIPLAALLLTRYWIKPSLIKIALLAFSFSLIILSHPFFGIIMAPLFLGLTFYLFLRNKSFLKLGGLTIALIFTLGLTAYFTIPLLIENKYLHYDINPFVNTYKTEGITLSQLILPQWTFIDKTGKIEYQTWQLGILNMAIPLLALPLLFFTRLKQKALLGLGLFLATLASIMSLKAALPLYEIFKPLQQVQFPWRFLALNVTSLPFMATPIFAFAESRFKNLSYLVGMALVVLILALNLPYARGHQYQTKTDNYYLYEMTNNTEGVATQPRWSALAVYYPKKTAQLQIIDGQGISKETFINSISHRYQIEAKTPLYLVDNTFYFPGWRVKTDKQETPIEFQNENYRGLITFHVPRGSHEVEVRFENTKLRAVAEKISLVTFMATVFVLLIIGSRPFFRQLKILLFPD